MDHPKKKVAIVGGGFAGITSIITLKEENFEPICFEKSDKFGGTWCYRENSVVGLPSTMPTTVINQSKEFSAISNFPPKKEYPNHMRHNEVFEYIMDFATKNDALRHIRCNSEVTKVTRSDDYDETGKWIVTVRNTLTGTEESDAYDFVLICVGHINQPKWPNYEGMDSFKGKILHTHSLKSVVEYEGKNVVVVGMGCSGLDAAVEISSVAKQVYLSTRSGAHVISRIGSHGYPIDYILARRYILTILNILPKKVASWIFQSLVTDPKFNHRWYTVPPKWPIFFKDPSINDHIGTKLLSGVVKQKKDIKYFTENGVIFDDELTCTEVDVVIMATGYTWGFPFLEEGIVIQEEGRINLYKCMWPPHLKHSTLAIIGFLLPFGPGFPLGELQTRWAAQVFAGNKRLPSYDKMMKDIKQKHQANVSRYAPSEKQTLRVDYQPYLDDIASQIDAKPNLLKMLFLDPQLCLKLIFGPSLSYQYRLVGPHKWDGARNAIMTCEERVHYPMKNYSVKRLENPFMIFIKKILQLLFLL